MLGNNKVAPVAIWHAFSVRKMRLFLQLNMHFFKKLPVGVEAANIMIGQLDVLRKPVHALIRLAKPTYFGNLTEVPAPTRFIFVLLGPKSSPLRYHHIGRTMGTLMSDEVRYMTHLLSANSNLCRYHALSDESGYPSLYTFSICSCSNTPFIRPKNGPRYDFYIFVFLLTLT